MFNDTRVIPARLFGRKASGGRIELLIERVLDERRALVQIHASKAPKPGGQLLLDGGFAATVLARHDALFEIAVAGDESVLTLLERHGQVLLPPYIHRAPTAEDRDRYQTVYARQPGAVAAPTAGLHFDQACWSNWRRWAWRRPSSPCTSGPGPFSRCESSRLRNTVCTRNGLR